MRLKDKVAIITGGSRGIGFATADKFLKEGASVVLAASSQESADVAVDKLKEKYPNAIVAGISPNLASMESVRKAFKEVTRKYGCVDILVNNAAVIVRKNIVDTTAEEWDHAMNVGVRGTFLFSKYILPVMIRQKKGNIINTASNCAVSATPGAASYNAVKGAVASLTRAMAVDHAEDNIRVNCVCPGDVITPMLINEGIQTGKITTGNPQTVEEINAWNAFIKECGSHRPMGRISTPEEIAYTYLYLATDMSGYATGSSVIVDGGRVC